MASGRTEQEARVEAHRACPRCDAFEVWVLDCYEIVECPDGVDDYIHLHARCGRCGYEQLIAYEDSPVSVLRHVTPVFKPRRSDAPN